MALKGAVTVYDDFTAVDTDKRMPLGTVIDAGNRKYIYVQGVTSGAVNKWATYTSAGVTTLLAADAVGPCGVMMATLDATTDYGFLCIYAPEGVSAATDTVAANTVPYIDGTAGRVDDAAVVGDKVYNAIIFSADTANVATVGIWWPYVTNESN